MSRLKMSRKSSSSRTYQFGFNSGKYGTVYNQRGIDWATPRLANTRSTRSDIRREAADTCRNLVLTETSFREPPSSVYSRTNGTHLDYHPVKESQGDNFESRPALLTDNQRKAGRQSPISPDYRPSRPRAFTGQQLQGSLNSSTGNELAELLSRHQEKQLQSMKSMSHQLRKWNSCSLLDESDLLKPEMYGLPLKLHGSAEQLNRIDRENAMTSVPKQSSRVISATGEGTPNVLSNQQASVAYVTPWRQEVLEAHDQQMTFSDGDGFATPPGANHSRSDSLSSSDDSGKWDSLLRAKDGLICQKDQIIDRQKKTILQLQQQQLEMDAKLRQALTSKIVQGQPQEISQKLQEYQYDSARLRAQLAQVMADKDAEIAKLEKKLGETEYLLLKMEASLKDTAFRKGQELEEMQNKIGEKDKAISELHMKIEVSGQEQQGLRRRIESLERYLSDTPTAEEHQNTVKNLKEARDESSRLKDTIALKDKKLAHMNKALAHKVKEVGKLSQANSEFKEKVGSLEKSVHKYKNEGPVSEIEFDDLKMEHERVQAELERTKKMLENKHKKMKALHQQSQQTQKNLEQRLSHEEDTVTALREDAGEKERAVDELRKSVKQLARVNQDLMEQNLNYKNVCDQHAKCVSKDRVDANRRLWKELSRCVNELKGVVEICSARRKGEDPNMSLLLGHSVHGEENVDEEPQDEVDAIRSKTLKLQELRSEIDQLRTFISDQYAEEVGNNCITQ